jgi:ATP-dependent Lon protease
VNFSYIDNETLEEFFVSVPEQGGSELIPAGHAKARRSAFSDASESGMMGLYRFETQMTAGNKSTRFPSGIIPQPAKLSGLDLTISKATSAALAQQRNFLNMSTTCM